MEKLPANPPFFIDQKFWETWLKEIADKIYWAKFSEDFAWNLLENTARAHVQKSEYYFQGLDNVDLTKIYQQCKLISLLSKEHNG